MIKSCKDEVQQQRLSKEICGSADLAAAGFPQTEGEPRTLTLDKLACRLTKNKIKDGYGHATQTLRIHPGVVARATGGCHVTTVDHCGSTRAAR